MRLYLPEMMKSWKWLGRTSTKQLITLWAFRWSVLCLAVHTVVVTSLMLFVPSNHPFYRYIVKISTFGLVPVVLSLRVLYHFRLYRLKRAQYKVCLKCGYHLTGLGDVGECPECGRPFDIPAVRAELG